MNDLRFRSLIVLFIIVVPTCIRGQPNIVIILADDLGWNDVGYHNENVLTPNIDQLVQDGIELNYFYTAPLCSPTRAGTLTGMYPLRYGLQRTIIFPWSEW